MLRATGHEKAGAAQEGHFHSGGLSQEGLDQSPLFSWRTVA